MIDLNCNIYYIYIYIDIDIDIDIVLYYIIYIYIYMYYTYHTGITIERPEERKQHPYIPLHSSLDLNCILP